MIIPNNCQGCNRFIDNKSLITISISDKINSKIKVYCYSCPYILLLSDNKSISNNFICFKCKVIDDIDKLWPVKVNNKLLMICMECCYYYHPLKTNYSLVQCIKCYHYKSIEYMYCYFIIANKWICKECIGNESCMCINTKYNFSMYSSVSHQKQKCKNCNKYGCITCMYKNNHLKCIESIIELIKCLTIIRSEIPWEIRKIIISKTNTPLNIISRYFHK